MTVGFVIWSIVFLVLVGIGICKPFYDPLTYESNHSILSNYVHFHDWIHHSLQPLLEGCAQVPVETFSPVTLPALAEQRFGAAKGARDFICVLFKIVMHKCSISSFSLILFICSSNVPQAIVQNLSLETPQGNALSTF